MALGDNRFDVSGLLGSGFNDHAIPVQLLPSQAGQNVPRDKFGRPTQTSTSVTVNIVVSKAEEQIQPDPSGGKPVEVLEFYALPGTVNENDEITWNNHSFRTSGIWPFGLGGITQLIFCKAEREVDR